MTSELRIKLFVMHEYGRKLRVLDEVRKRKGREEREEREEKRKESYKSCILSAQVNATFEIVHAQSGTFWCLFGEGK